MIDNKTRLYTEAVSAARGILNGQVGVIEGSRNLAALSRKFSADKRERFLLFIGIDSESDNLAIGPERQYWAEEALVKQDTEIENAEDYYKEDVFNACRALISLLESDLATLKSL